MGHDERQGVFVRGALVHEVDVEAVELGREPGNRYVQIDGSMLSADISGFTALSEKLAAKGKAGAEEITELINLCFTALIGEAYAQNGEIIKFGVKARDKGLTLVPLRMYFRSNRVKVEIGLARGKKQHDKRDSIAKRDAKRAVERALKEARNR